MPMLSHTPRAPRLFSLPEPSYTVYNLPSSSLPWRLRRINKLAYETAAGSSEEIKSHRAQLTNEEGILFGRNEQQTQQRLCALKSMLKNLGVDILTDAMIEKLLMGYRRLCFFDEALLHPNQEDFGKAREFVERVLERLASTVE